jgi:hypothetical protein
MGMRLGGAARGRQAQRACGNHWVRHHLHRDRTPPEWTRGVRRGGVPVRCSCERRARPQADNSQRAQGRTRAATESARQVPRSRLGRSPPTERSAGHAATPPLRPACRSSHRADRRRHAQLRPAARTHQQRWQRSERAGAPATATVCLETAPPVAFCTRGGYAPTCTARFVGSARSACFGAALPVHPGRDERARDGPECPRAAQPLSGLIHQRAPRLAPRAQLAPQMNHGEPQPDSSGRGVRARLAGARQDSPDCLPDLGSGEDSAHLPTRGHCVKEK